MVTQSAIVPFPLHTPPTPTHIISAILSLALYIPPAAIPCQNLPCTAMFLARASLAAIKCPLRVPRPSLSAITSGTYKHQSSPRPADRRGRRRECAGGGVGGRRAGGVGGALHREGAACVPLFLPFPSPLPEDFRLTGVFSLTRKRCLPFPPLPSPPPSYLHAPHRKLRVASR